MSTESQTTVPIVALGPDDDRERSEWLEALGRVIDDNAYCLGRHVESFEEQVSEVLGVPHAIGLSSGTDALRLGLDAFGIGPGDEVIVPAFTFFASASTVAHLGAKPVFVDIDPDTLLINPEAVQASYTAQTKAIVPVHLYGQLVPMEQITEPAASRGIHVLEDAAQSFGVRYQGTTAGALGDAGTFSFYPTKNLGAPGDAGMLVTTSDEIAERVRLQRMHGDLGGYRHTQIGYNARMDGFQAAILSIKLRRLDAMQRARQQNASRYLEAFEAKGLLERVRPVARVEGSEHCWHQFIVRVKNRTAVRKHLTEKGIQTGIHYPGPLPLQRAFECLGHKPGEFPNAERAGQEVLALPIHHRLQESDCARVVDALAEAVS